MQQLCVAPETPLCTFARPRLCVWRRATFRRQHEIAIGSHVHIGALRMLRRSETVRARLRGRGVRGRPADGAERCMLLRKAAAVWLIACSPRRARAWTRLETRLRGAARCCSHLTVRPQAPRMCRLLEDAMSRRPGTLQRLSIRPRPTRSSRACSSVTAAGCSFLLDAAPSLPGRPLSARWLHANGDRPRRRHRSSSQAHAQCDEQACDCSERRGRLLKSGGRQYGTGTERSGVLSLDRCKRDADGRKGAGAEVQGSTVTREPGE
jgi:hypothetical protein